MSTTDTTPDTTIEQVLPPDLLSRIDGRAPAL